MIDRLTVSQLRELEALTQHSALLQRLLSEFKEQRAALASMQQYVEMFSDAEGAVENVVELLTDLRDILDGVTSAGRLAPRS